MEHELKQGQALVIVGAQGSGKTTLARKIAERYGSFIEVSADRLESHQGLNDLLAHAKQTVIVEGFPENKEQQCWLKALITTPTIKVEKKYGVAETVKVPNFIFCTSDADPLPKIEPGRRFRVIKL
ncbi:MAG TPA: DUF5906 domain-containing protein [Rhodocyclaceae bacterium]|jgi:energy-coupling factor transporter ATP-binding protein EcfA2